MLSALLLTLPFVILFDAVVCILHRRYGCSISKARVVAIIIVMLAVAPCLQSVFARIPALIAKGFFGWAGATVSRMSNRGVQFQHSDTYVGHIYACCVLVYHFTRSLCRLTTFLFTDLANFPGFILLVIAILALAQGT